MFERDKEAAKLSIEFESLTNINIDKNTDCASVKDYQEKCKYAFYLLDSNEGIMKALELLINLLMCVGLGSLGVAGTIEVWRKKS